MNFRPETTLNGSKVYGYRRIGGWDRGQLTMDDDIFWPGNQRGYVYSSGAIKSVCSEPCPHGEIKVSPSYPHGELKVSSGCTHMEIKVNESLMY